MTKKPGARLSSTRGGCRGSSGRGHPVGTGSVSEPAAATPAAPEAPAATSTPGRPEHRQGRKNLSVWVNDRAHRTLKAIRGRGGGVTAGLVIDMLNREFARKGAAADREIASKEGSSQASQTTLPQCSAAGAIEWWTKWKVHEWIF